MLGPFRQFSVDFIFFWLGHKKRLWRFYLLTTVVILMKNGWRHLHQMWLRCKSHFVKVVNMVGEWWMVLSTIEGQTVDCYPLRQSEELDYAGWVKSEKSEWGCRVEEAVSPERERVSLKQTEQQTSHGWHCAEDQGKHLLYKTQSTLQMISLFALQRDQTKLRIMNFIMVLQRHLENILLSWKEFFEKLKFNETSNTKNYIKWKCFLCRIYFLVIFCEMILLCGLS